MPRHKIVVRVITCLVLMSAPSGCNKSTNTEQPLSPAQVQSLGRPADPQLPSAEFSPTDPYRTLSWVVRHFKPIEDVQLKKNLLLEEKREKEFETQMAHARGQKINWRLRCQSIGITEVTFHSVIYPAYSSDAPANLDNEKFPDDKFPCYTLRCQDVRITNVAPATREWLVSLVAGDEVVVRGEITRIGMEHSTPALRSRLPHLNRTVNLFTVFLMNASLSNK